MSYECDICSGVVPSRESGFAFARNRVLASPGYWEYVFRNAAMSRPFTEEAMGLAVRQLLMSERDYVICGSCKDMLGRDADKAKDYRIDPWFTTPQAMNHSVPDRAQAKEQLQATLITIGTVYERKCGKWPSFVSRDEFEEMAARWVRPKPLKWWQDLWLYASSLAWMSDR
jgi:hypothetical protein